MGENSIKITKQLVESETQTDDVTLPVNLISSGGQSQNTQTILPIPNITLSDEVLARNLQIQENFACASQPQKHIGKLDITVCQASLTKAHTPLSIPFIRMDPYVKILLGNFMFETATDYNGSTNPAWNQTLFCYVPQKYSSMQVEVYDERSFSQDEKVAWATIQIPENLYNDTQGGIEDSWYDLQGRNGESAGRIRIIINFIPSSILNSNPRNLHNQPNQTQNESLPPLPTIQPTLTPEQIELEVGKFKDMFPNLDSEIIKTVFESNAFDQNTTANALLTLNES